MKKYTFLFLFFSLSTLVKSQLSVTTGQTAANLANTLLGGGVVITNPVLTCPSIANGVFSNGASTSLSPLTNGVVLSTGNAANIPFAASNQSSVDNNVNAGAAWSSLTGSSSSYDLCMLEFDIEPKCNNLKINYRFGSEEYPEYEGAGYNDAFGFFISGPNPSGGTYNNYNIALVPGTSLPVNIDNINNGPSNSGPCNHCAYYVNTSSSSSIVYDGLTTVLTASANVTPCSSYHLKLAIVDGGDPNYDSGVFLQQSGISCTSPTVTAANAVICAGQSATLTASGTTTYSWSTGATSSSIVVSPTVTTSYTVGGSNIGTCIQDSKVVTVTVNGAVAGISPPSIITCSAPSITLSGSGGGNYNWSGPGIVSGGNTANPVVNQPGTYNMTVTTLGCTDTKTISVTQNTVTPSVSANTTGSLSCTTTTINATASTTSTPVSYSWSGPGILSGGSTGTVVVNTGGNYNYTVTNTANGCKATGSVAVIQNVSTPSVSSSANGTLTCNNITANIALTTTATPVSYTWSGPGITGGAGTATVTVNQGGTYNYTVTNTSNGCTTVGSQAVAQNTTPPAVTASSGTITCAVTTATAAASTAVSPVTYNWSGAGITAGQGTGTITVGQGGTYNYTVTSTANGCSTMASLSVQTNTTAPTVTVTPATFTTTCAAPSVTLNASSSTSGVSYAWSSVGGSLSNTNTASPVATGGGVYTATVTDPGNGCQSSGSATVVPDASAPTASISPSTASITCLVSSVSATVTATPSSNLTYSWSPAPAAGQSSAVATFTASGIYVCTITNTVNACTASSQINVSTDTVTPTVAITPSQTLTCAAPVAAIHTTATPTPVTYTWTGAGITGATANDSVVVNQAGTYTVLVTDPVNGCTVTATSSINSNINSPTATITPVSSNSVITCANPTVSLGISTTPASGITYTWTPAGATTSTTSVSSAGPVSVIILNTATGCTATTQYTVTGSTMPPQVSASTAQIPCAATSTTISASSTNTNVSYNWTTSNGTINSGSATATPDVGSAGDYVVTVTDNNNGCSSTATVSVTQSSVTAAFTANPLTGLAPLAVNFTNQSTGANTYTWIFGDGNSSTATNPSNTYNSNGSYTVELIAMAGPCADTAYAVIVVQSGLTLEIPNVFTPNGDNVNDVFTIKSTGVKDISLQIFNRWGEKLYDFSGPNAAWDGKTGEGSKASDGTYFYFVKATGYDSKTIEQQGTVSLYR